MKSEGHRNKAAKRIDVEIEISVTHTPEEEAKRKREILWDDFFGGCFIVFVLSAIVLAIAVSVNLPVTIKCSFVVLFFSGSLSFIGFIRNINRGYTSLRAKDSETY